jgi:hypothetical protein
VQIVARGSVKSIFKDLNFLNDHHLIIVWGNVLHQLVLSIERNAPGLSVLPDKSMHRVAIPHPADQPGIGRQGYHCIASDGQVSIRSFALLSQQIVHKPKQLHDSLILPQILMPFQEELVLTAVAPDDRQLPGPLFRLDDLHSSNAWSSSGLTLTVVPHSQAPLDTTRLHLANGEQSMNTGHEGEQSMNTGHEGEQSMNTGHEGEQSMNTGHEGPAACES